MFIENNFVNSLFARAKLFSFALAKETERVAVVSINISRLQRFSINVR